MQKIVFILSLLFTVSACQQDRNNVEFKRVDNLDMGNLSKGDAKLSGTLVFTNLSENDLSVKDIVMDYTVDGKDIGTVVVKSGKKITAKAEFSIPFQYNYNTGALKLQGHDPSAKYAIVLKGKITLLDATNKEVTADIKYSESFEYHTKQEIRQQKRDDRKEQRQERREQRKERREQRKNKQE